MLWLLQRLMAQLMGIIGVMAGLDNKIKSKISLMGHVNEYPTMHCFGIPRHTQSMIVYKILTEVFLEIQVKNCIVGMLITCPILSVHCLILAICRVIIIKHHNHLIASRRRRSFLNLFYYLLAWQKNVSFPGILFRLDSLKPQKIISANVVNV